MLTEHFLHQIIQSFLNDRTYQFTIKDDNCEYSYTIKPTLKSIEYNSCESVQEMIIDSLSVKVSKTELMRS